MNNFTCELEKSQWSNISQQWEMAVWFKRKTGDFSDERILLLLGSRFTFVSIYINRIGVERIIKVDGEQIAHMMSNGTSIADVFEYCRKHFCRQLTPVKRSAKPKQEVDQLDMFEVV